MPKKLEFSRKLQLWMDELPIADHPLYKLVELLKDDSLPASLRVEALLGAARFFSPIYSSSKNEVAGTLEHKQTTITSVDVVRALASCDPETRKKILTGAGVLQLESGNSDES